MTLKEAIDKLSRRQQKLMSSPNTDIKDVAELEGQWNRLLDEHPNNPIALFMLGNLYLRLDSPGLGIALLEKAIMNGAGGASIFIALGIAYKTALKTPVAVEYFKQAIDVARETMEKGEPHGDEDLAAAYNGMASLYINTGTPSKCVYWAERALKIMPTERHALWNKGLAHLELGEWTDGFRLYDEAGFMDGGTKPRERKLKTYGGLPKWDGTPGKTVITYGEQGVGDEIMFVSMLPDLMKDCRVIVDCDKRIEAMIKRSFPDLEAVYPTSDVNAAFDWIANHKVDAFVPMGSLGRHYRKTAADFPKVPYLKADPEKIEKWRDILAPYKGFRVGISWAGGSRKTNADKRSIGLDKWGDILKTPGVDFFSLQYHDWAADQAAEAGTAVGVPIHHWRDMIADYEETAGFLANLDLVITVNTSLHHLAGALGTQQWCLTPKHVAWRYGIKGPSPWYGNCLMLRQREDEQWNDVMATAAKMLADRAGSRVAA